MGYKKLRVLLMTILLVFTGISPVAAEQVTDANNPADVATITDNVVDFYHDNQKICDAALDYYNGYESNLDQYVNAPQYVSSEEEFLAKLPYETILVMMVNPIDRGIFLRYLSETAGQPLDTYQIGDFTCNICNLDNRISIIHVNPGKTGEEYTRRAINQMSHVIIPDYICLLGICYGMNMEKHSIGDVFISDRVKTFRLNFRDSLMYTRCNNILTINGETYPANAEVGLFLSCNSLMSSSKVKQAITEQYKIKGAMPLGGEMEGAGLLKSTIVEGNNYDNWLIIKSICDWGEKKNALDPDPKISEHIKDSLQAYAMTNTCGVFTELLKNIF